MKICIASGKGGAGKTSLAASLCQVWQAPLALLDLDVEEPNLGLFIKPGVLERRVVNLAVPVLDPEACDLCGACSDFCRFKALSRIGSRLLVNSSMCHACGGCFRICPRGALSLGYRELGHIEVGQAKGNLFVSGCLKVGEAMSPPLMRAAVQCLDELNLQGADVLIDSPPGVSCPAVTAAGASDFIVLVCEPTPFGFYDFKLAVEAFSVMGKSLAVVLNRYDGLGGELEEYCGMRGLPVLARIPESRAVAEAYSLAIAPGEASSACRKVIEDLRDKLLKLGRGGGNA